MKENENKNYIKLSLYCSFFLFTFNAFCDFKLALAKETIQEGING
jgi:hypothetical protein